jgi:hypothetical protein
MNETTEWLREHLLVAHRIGGAYAEYLLFMNSFQSGLLASEVSGPITESLAKIRGVTEIELVRQFTTAHYGEDDPGFLLGYRFHKENLRHGPTSTTHPSPPHAAAADTGSVAHQPAER